MAVHETKRRGLVEEKLNSYVEECAYLRRTLGAAMGAASRDELLADVEKIRDAEQAASQQLLRAPPGSSYPPPSPLPQDDDEFVRRLNERKYDVSSLLLYVVWVCML